MNRMKAVRGTVGKYQIQEVLECLKEKQKRLCDKLTHRRNGY
ncbi:hypothetical protein [Clostridioides difficile]|nr:hypothetical protein [Clostridioides difficile]